jgi:hypothetical protein
LYIELCTIHGTAYDTFQQAAQAAGLFQEAEEGLLAMGDAIAQYNSPNQLRFLFCLLILEGLHAVPLWSRFADDLARDFGGNTFGHIAPHGVENN